jgi:hypothetical protein
MGVQMVKNRDVPDLIVGYVADVSNTLDTVSLGT